MFKALFLFLAIGALSLLGYHEYKKNTNSLDANGNSIASHYAGQAKDKLLEGVERLKDRLNLGDKADGQIASTEEVATELAETAEASAEGVQEDVENAVSNAEDEASEATDALTEQASNAADSVKDQADDALDSATTELKAATDAVKDQAGDVADTATGLAADAVEAAGSATDQATKAAKDAAEQAKDIAEDVKELASDAAETIKDKTDNVMENTIATTEEASNDIAASAEDTGDASKEVETEANASNIADPTTGTPSNNELSSADENENLSLSGLSRVLGNALGSTKSVLAGVSDEASAKEALPRLQEANDSVQRVAKLIPNIPDVAKGPLSKLVGNGLSGIKPLADSALSLPGVGDTLQPALGPMLDTLSKLSE